MPIAKNRKNDISLLSVFMNKQASHAYNIGFTYEVRIWIFSHSPKTVTFLDCSKFIHTGSHFIILIMKNKLNKEKVPSVLGSPKNGAASFKKQLDPKAGLGKAKSTLLASKSS